MIRLNLLGDDRGRQDAAGVRRVSVVPVAACLVVAPALLLAGWCHRSLTSQAAALDRALADARQEATHTGALAGEMAALEKQRAEVVERIAVFEEARRDQTTSVQLLDHVGRSVPGGLSLTTLQRNDGEVSIEGRSSTHAAVAEFVTNLDASAIFLDPVELVRSEMPPAPGSRGGVGPQLILFTIRAGLRTGGQRRAGRAAGERPAP